VEVANANYVEIRNFVSDNDCAFAPAKSVDVKWGKEGVARSNQAKLASKKACEIRARGAFDHLHFFSMQNFCIRMHFLFL
jgi:hypothetical protein